MRRLSASMDDHGGCRVGRRRLLAGAAAFGAGLAALLLAGTAQAQSLGELRASGALGEAFDGYARARQASAQATVRQVNAKRRQIYASRAKQKGTTADQVGRVYARQIMAKAPRGTWFLEESGRWARK